MKILQVTDRREFTILDAPVPTPGSGQVLLRIEAVTTCPQWDLHLRHNNPMFVGHQFVYPYTPGQPGHEAAGVVEAVGKDVTTVKPGDRVCAWRDAGHDVPGCYAQYVVHNEGNVIKIPDGIEFEDAAPLELAMCVGATFLVLNDMRVLKGRRVGVGGLGPAGLVAAQMARAEGAAEVIGFDLSPRRREYAATFAVDSAYDPREAPVDVFPVRPYGASLQTSIDCVGAKASVEFLMDRTIDTVALFGVQREDYTFAVRHYGMLRLCGYPGHSREAAEYAVGLLAAGKLKLRPLVTHYMPLEKYAEGIDLLERQEAIKICFQPWK